MRLTVLLILILLALPVCSEVNFGLRWEYYLVNGIKDFYVFDLDKDGAVEIYGCSYEPTRPTLWALSSDGKLLYGTLIPRPGLVDFGTEKVTLMRPTDLNSDRVLDILSTTEIISAGMNAHRLYRLERIYESDLKRYRTDMSWMYTRTGLITGIVLLDGGVNESYNKIYFSSEDATLRSVDTKGNLIGNITLKGSIWDICPVVFSNKSVGLIAASFRHVYAFDSDLKLLWDYPFDVSFSNVYASDVNNDSAPEIFAVSEGILYRLTVNGTLVWNKSITGLKTNVFSADFDHDGFEDILVGAEKKVFGLNPKGEVLWTVDLGDNPNYLYAYDLSNSGNLSLIAALSSGIKVFDLGFSVNETAVSITNAKAMLVLAKEYFNRGNYSLALNYSGKAKESFTTVGDNASIGECEVLLEKAKWAISADQYYNKALSDFKSGLYYDAMNYTSLSLELYSKLGFADGVNKTISLNRSIYYSLYGEGNLTLAQYFYSKAESYYVNSQFDLAVDYAKNASMYYDFAGDSVGVAKSKILMDSSLEKLPKVSRATTTFTTKWRVTTTTTLPQARDYTDYILAGGVVLLIVIVFFAFRRK